jgi:hypothetical protein
VTRDDEVRAFSSRADQGSPQPPHLQTMAKRRSAAAKAGAVHDMTPPELFNVMVRAVVREDRLLRGLLSRREGYETYAPGILSTYETGAVYAIFKELVSSLPFGWVVEWESPHGVGHKKIDLVVRRSRGAMSRWGVEAKWWTKGGYGIADDCKKLLTASGLKRRFILAISVRMASRSWELEDLITRSIRCGRLEPFHVKLLCSERRKVLGYGGVAATFGMALLEVFPL